MLTLFDAEIEANAVDSIYSSTGTLEPEQTILECFIPGKPEPQGSAKAFVMRTKTGGMRAATTTTNPKLYQWRALAVTVIQAAFTETKTDRAVAVQALIVMPRLSSHPKFASSRAKPVGHHVSTPDTDKLQRSIGDSLTVAGVMSDDKQIVCWQAYKRYAKIGEAPGVHLTVQILPEATS